jgi:hypothetical protein
MLNFELRRRRVKKIVRVSVFCMVFLTGVFLSGALAVSTTGGQFFEPDSNRPGMDYKKIDVKSDKECAEACKLDPKCKAFSVEKPMNLQKQPYPICRLKNGIPAKITDKRFISGLKSQAQAQNPYKQNPNVKMNEPVYKEEQKLKAPPQIGNKSKIVPCPETVVVKNIDIEPDKMSATPGFFGVGIGNPPSTFTVFRTGANTMTDCFCEYRNGTILARVRIDINGYTNCWVNNKNTSIELTK